MNAFLLSLVLKTAILVLTLNCNSAISERNEDPQVTLIYKRFKTKSFAATLVHPNKVLISWSIELDNTARAKDYRERTFTIFGNNELISKNSITIENYCKNVMVINGSMILKCNKVYYGLDCMNYQFILGSTKNVAFITTVPVIKNTTTFEMIENEGNLAKLTWKIKCNTNNYMNPVPVSFKTKNNETVVLALSAVCNPTQQSCETILNMTGAISCVPPIIQVNHETVSLNVAKYFVNFSNVVSKLNEIEIEWTDKICPVPSHSSISPSYKLVIIENEKNQIVHHGLVQNWCIIPRIGNPPRQILTFNKNQITSCFSIREKNLKLETTLRACLNYSVYVFRSENENPTLGKERYKNSFAIKTLELEDIQNLRVANLSSDRFELQWEMYAGCRKVENFIIPIYKNNYSIHNITLSSNNTKCNDSTCIVSWKYDQNLTPCKQYAIRVGRSNILQITTLPPGAASFIGSSSKSHNSSGFDLEWNVPYQCRQLLNTTIQEERNTNSYFISSASSNLTEKCRINGTCQMIWHYAEKLEPCTTYYVNLGSFPQQFTTYPNFSGGIASNVIIRTEVSESLFEPATPVIRWDHPNCQKSKILEWQILIRKSRSNHTIVKRISSLEHSYKFVDTEACEKYSFAIRTIFENNGSDFYLTPEEQFEVDCPLKLLVPIGLIAGLLLIAIIIALFLLRTRKRKEALIKESENIDKLSSVESRDRIAMSRNSFNENAEMDLDCLPQMTKRPMNVRDICSFDVGQARKEFFLINKLTEIEAKRFPRTTAERPENKFKNRFLNTHPYDFNRVILSQSEEGQDDGYINASFIPGFDEKEKEYIAAQGPKDNTLGDFWQMILEQDVRLIAMVTSLNECGKKKCEKYWPDKDELVFFSDNIQLELLEETTYSFYTTRNILVSKAREFKREIRQFHFTALKDFETPDQPEELIRFIEIVRKKARKLNFLLSPIVVHGSAGVGRTGTFIALDYLIQQVLITDLIDVPKTVRHLRRYRLSMVQSEAQYVFLYSCIAHYIKKRLGA